MEGTGIFIKNKPLTRSLQIVLRVYGILRVTAQQEEKGGFSEVLHTL